MLKNNNLRLEVNSNPNVKNKFDRFQFIPIWRLIIPKKSLTFIS